MRKMNEAQALAKKILMLMVGVSAMELTVIPASTMDLEFEESSNKDSESNHDIDSVLEKISDIIENDNIHELESKIEELKKEFLSKKISNEMIKLMNFMDVDIETFLVDCIITEKQKKVSNILREIERNPIDEVSKNEKMVAGLMSSIDNDILLIKNKKKMSSYEEKALGAFLSKQKEQKEMFEKLKNMPPKDKKKFLLNKIKEGYETIEKSIKNAHDKHVDETEQRINESIDSIRKKIHSFLMIKDGGDEIKIDEKYQNNKIEKIQKEWKKEKHLIVLQHKNAKNPQNPQTPPKNGTPIEKMPTALMGEIAKHLSEKEKLKLRAVNKDMKEKMDKTVNKIKITLYRILDLQIQEKIKEGMGEKVHSFHDIETIIDTAFEECSKNKLVENVGREVIFIEFAASYLGIILEYIKTKQVGFMESYAPKWVWGDSKTVSALKSINKLNEKLKGKHHAEIKDIIDELIKLNLKKDSDLIEIIEKKIKQMHQDFFKAWNVLHKK